MRCADGHSVLAPELGEPQPARSVGGAAEVGVVGDFQVVLLEPRGSHVVAIRSHSGPGRKKSPTHTGIMTTSSRRIVRPRQP